MSKSLSIITALLSLVLLVGASARAAAQSAPQGGTPSEERAGSSLAVKPDVTVSLVAKRGRVTVRGWERQEVHATSDTGGQIELQRADETKETDPAQRVQVVLSPATNSVDLNVPRGATVRLRVSGEVSVDDVAEVEIEAADGTVYLRNISRSTEVSNLGNTILKESSGRIYIRTVGGTVEVSDVQPSGGNDTLQVNSVSGDCIFERIGHARVEAETITGNVTLLGALAPSARYNLRTTSGDVRLVLPADASFQVNSRVGEEGEFANEFPLKAQGSGKSSGARQLSGTHGSGDATLNLTSFNGSVRLRRKT
jgi:DUF4097 and DUF4098 domain-containing protein YvlB